jgi:hypothetical protein
MKPKRELAGLKTKLDVESLEKLIGQLTGLHSEIAQLAKKSPNDGLNIFKLKFVNKVLETGNTILGARYKPFDDFSEFDKDNLPTNSDVTMILAQYMERTERFRSDNVVWYAHQWVYQVNGQPSEINGSAPTRIGAAK